MLSLDEIENAVLPLLRRRERGHGEDLERGVELRVVGADVRQHIDDPSAHGLDLFERRMTSGPPFQSIFTVPLVAVSMP